MFCPAPRAQRSTRSLVERADVAQLVAHHLAKVRVAGSNPVIRSKRVNSRRVVWPSGEATACKAVYTGSIPVATSRQLNRTRAISSVGERFPDTEEVTSSILVSRTLKAGPGRSAGPCFFVSPGPEMPPASPPRRCHPPFGGPETESAQAFWKLHRCHVMFCPAPRTTTIHKIEFGQQCGCSAAGSASPCQGEGRGFESRHPLGVRIRQSKMTTRD